jgi:hypothetical protein
MNSVLLSLPPKQAFAVQGSGTTLLLWAGEFGRTPHSAGRDGRDLHATILHLLGLDHERLTFRFSGQDFRLIDVHGRVIREIVG